MTKAVTGAWVSPAGQARVPITATSGPQANVKTSGLGLDRRIRGGSAELQADMACATLTA